MRRHTVDRRMVVCAGLVIGVLGLSAPRPPLPAVPQALDEMLDVALRSNPEILVAEAKLRQAMAELNQVRLKVTQDVVKLQAHRESLARAREGRKVELLGAEERFSEGLGPRDDLMKAQLAYAEAQAAFGEWPALARYLLGLGGSPALGPDQTQPRPGSSAAPQSRARPAVPDKFKEVLEMSFALNLGDQQDLSAVLRVLQDLVGKKMMFMAHKEVVDHAITLPVTHEMPLRSILLAIHDRDPFICFVVREYGILATDEASAVQLAGAAIPEDLPYIPNEGVPQ